MKMLSLIAITLFVHFAHAEMITVGCIEGQYFCAGQDHCNWIYGRGVAGEVEILKTASSAQYDIYEGQFSGKLNGGQAFKTSIYQRREPSQTVNFITIEVEMGKLLLSSQGKGSSEIRHLDLESKKGISFQCTTDLQPNLLPSWK